MRMSIIEARDMLSTLSAHGGGKADWRAAGRRKRYSEFAAGSGTVRYAETRQVTAPLMEPTIVREVCHD